MTLRRRLGRIVAGGPASATGSAARSGSKPAAAPAASAGPTKGRMLRAKPPNVVGRGPLLAGPGFGVVVVCIVKDEADYLEEWLAYHVALGVDHFVIYDNGSTDGSAELLERFINHGLVTRIDWPLGGGQLAAYNHALRLFGAATRWLAYFDVDEFLVPLLDDDIPGFLDRFDDAAVVRVPRVEFGFSGHRTAPAALAIDAYTQVANVLDLDPGLPPRVKSIVQPGAVSAVDIHLAFPADVATPGIPTETAEESVRGVAQLNHYYTRSFEEFEAKRFRGSATGRIARAAVPFDIETIATDTAAPRFSERTQASLERLRSLSPRPYIYGSQLALEYFPRPNDLFRFGEFAIANTAAGLAGTRSRRGHPAAQPVRRRRPRGRPGRQRATPPVRDGALRLRAHPGADRAHARSHRDDALRRRRAAHHRAVGTLAIPTTGPASLQLSGRVGRGACWSCPRTRSVRCYSLGFVVGRDGAGAHRCHRRRRGWRGEPTRRRLQLPASAGAGGHRGGRSRDPVHGRRLRLTVESRPTDSTSTTSSSSPPARLPPWH